MAIEPQNAGMGTILMEQSRALEQNKTTTVKEIAAKSSQLDEQLILSNKEMNKLLNERLKFDAKDLDAIEKLTESIKDIRGPIARMIDGIKNFVRPIQDFVKNPGRGILKAVNFGGIFNKTIAKSEFIEQQKMLGSKKTNKELALDFGENYDSKRELKNINTKLQKFRDAGLSEEQIGRTEMGSQLLSQRSEALESLGNTDIRARFKTDDQFNTIAPVEKMDSATGEPVSAATNKEEHLENVRMMDDQNDLLNKIEENTRGGGVAAGSPQPAGAGGGLMGKIGQGMKGFGDMAGSLLKGAVGLVAIAGALWISTKALKGFAELEWETLAKGIGTLGALAAIGIIAGKASGSMLKGALGLAALTGVMWLASKALEAFEGIGWDTVAKGLLTLAGVGVIGAIAGTAAPLIISGAVALGLMGGALWVVGEAMQAIGAGLSDMTTGLERMGNISGDNLLGVAAGIVAISGAMIAFAATNVVSGLANLVTGLLSIGQDTPIEQLIKIGNAGAGIEAAAKGLHGLSESMGTFGNVDTDKFGDAMTVLSNAPWRRMTSFVEAGGYMNSDGTIVSNASAITAGARDEAVAGGGGGSVVVAPTNNTVMQNQNQVVRLPLRNTDSSARRFDSGAQYSGYEWVSP
jgi:hypothetical protein